MAIFQHCGLILSITLTFYLFNVCVLFINESSKEASEYVEEKKLPYVREWAVESTEKPGT